MNKILIKVVIIGVNGENGENGEIGDNGIIAMEVMILQKNGSQIQEIFNMLVN